MTRKKSQKDAGTETYATISIQTKWLNHIVWILGFSGSGKEKCINLWY
jgi:hypothetical protein